MTGRAPGLVRLSAVLAIGVVWVYGRAVAAVDAEQLDFFERRVRPVLIESCYPCHSVESGKAKGGLRVDTSVALLEGGDRGPAVLSGDPDASWLIRAVRFDESDLHMPPKSHGGRLAEEQIEDLIAWVSMGAPDPRVELATVSGELSGDPGDDPGQHWAFQRVVGSEPPGVGHPEWVRTSVDAFVLGQLERRELRPADPAASHDLLRRITYDLTGLPPTPEEMEEFLADPSAGAYERVVERLLGSSHYGERWGRHWLDVARYADTKGYVFQEERRFPYAYTYRDYVVRAFNDDKPYDRFLVEQIAADQLELGEERSSLAAMGFLTVGRRFLNNQHDIIDDRIDVVTRGALGLTVACARCHDHKFDPISKEDYYALHGVFASSEEPEEKPLLGELRESTDYLAYVREREAIEAEIIAVGHREVEQAVREFRRQGGDYLFAALEYQLSQGSEIEDFAGGRKLTPLVLERWVSYLEDRLVAPDPVVLPGLIVALLSSVAHAEGSALLRQASPEDRAGLLPGNPILSRALLERSVRSAADAASVYSEVFSRIDEAWEAVQEEATKRGLPAPTSLPDADEEAVRAFLYAEDGPANPPRAPVKRLISRQIENATVKHRQRIEGLSWSHPGAPARAMVLQDRPDPANSRVFIRGNPRNPGVEVPRRFLSVLSGPEPTRFERGSGRLELARAIANRENPLTARVLVNRVWAWHFGRPLVDSPSDFGIRTERPVHWELLDWLAARFMAEGWSIKSLHRHIVLSSTYRQSSRAVAGTLEADPENRYLGRFNRQRLDFEAMRDSLLAVAGRLDRTLGGQPVDITGLESSSRRTIYGFVDRQNLPGMFRTFDFANPDVSSPGRFQTTVPQQALFLMNSPFALRQARALAERSAPDGAVLSEAARIEALYRLVYQREPDEAEQRLARDFLAGEPASPESGDDETAESSGTEAVGERFGRWEQLAQVLLLSNELLFLD